MSWWSLLCRELMLNAMRLLVLFFVIWDIPSPMAHISQTGSPIWHQGLGTSLQWTISYDQQNWQRYRARLNRQNRLLDFLHGRIRTPYGHRYFRLMESLSANGSPWPRIPPDDCFMDWWRNRFHITKKVMTLEMCCRHLLFSYPHVVFKNPGRAFISPVGWQTPVMPTERWNLFRGRV